MVTDLRSLLRHVGTRAPQLTDSSPKGGASSLFVANSLDRVHTLPSLSVQW